jgi:hypothetical protein
MPFAPLVNGASADAHGASNIMGMFAAFKALDQYLSTSGRQAGILMDVHSVLLRELLLFQTSASQTSIE